MNPTLADLSYLTGLHPGLQPCPLHWLWPNHLATGTLAVRPRSHLINRPAAQGNGVSPALGRVSSVVVFRFRVYEMACTPRRPRGTNNLPRPCRRLTRQCRIRCASIGHLYRQNPIVPATPQILINYPKILSLFVKQRTYPRHAAHKPSTNGHPP